jgi:UPF0182 protein CKL_0015
MSEENIVEKAKQKPNKKSKKRFFIVIAVAFIALTVAYVMFRGTYLETLEIGEKYITAFWQNIKYAAITVIINFGIIYFMFYITNIRIRNGLKEFFDQENKEMPKLLNKSISFIIAIIVSAATSSFIMEKLLLCFNSAQFGIQDPIFGMDIGYFVFQKPFIELVIWYFMAIMVALLIYMAIYYIVSFNMFFDGVDRKTLKNSVIIKQLTTFAMIITLLLAALVFVKTQDIGTEKFLTLKNEETSYSLYGAGLTDVIIKLWGYRILALVMIFSIYRGIQNFKQGKNKKVLICISIVPVYLVGLFFTLIIFQSVFITTNELDKEKKYIETNIEYTKNAYGIDAQEISMQTPEAITSQDITKYEDVLNNVNLMDSDIVLKDLNNGQTAKGYYSYRDTQVGKYLINGKTQLVYLSPREIISSTGTYNNKTYEYTHGYSTIVTSATTTTESGNLNHMQKGFEKTNEAITITQPRIYFGTQTNDTVVINSKDKKEFDYPILDSAEAENAENVYTGEAGLQLNFIDRIILAIKEGDLKLAFSGNVTSESKILTNRNIIKRAKTVMPYLMYDENPYTVVNDEGRIIWVLDAYTISDSYPYSQKTTIRQSATSKMELNYIRNSVKVLIDSYDGTISFYITDRTDPIAMAYKNIYPDLFMDLEEKIPADISEHFVYSKYLYEIQADIIARYHNVQADVLYRSNDIWEVASYNVGKVVTKTGTDIEPYYTMVKTENEEEQQLGLVLSYTPQGKQNLISYLVGTCDTSGKSKLTIYKYQADTNVLGPMQLDTQLSQDERIVKELETLNINGIKIIKNMVLVPLNDKILYVEPIYIQYLNEKDSLPTLKKVIVSSGNKIAIGDTLKQALTNLVSKEAVDIEIENTDTIEDLINTIINANNNLTNSNESNNWEMMGKDVSKLQELIDKLEKLVKENKAKNEIENKEIISNTLVNELD